MPADRKFSLLRHALRALGLSQEASDDVVAWVIDLLAGETHTEAAASPEFPYRLNDGLLTPAELSFFHVLQAATSDHAALCAKVGLGDLFRVQTDDQGHFRIYTNKIDRKHVDFLLCDPAPMRPLGAIELDDKSHLRADRRARNAFVDAVFSAAGLPLLHVPVKPGYPVADLANQITPYLASAPGPPLPHPAAPPTAIHEMPRCPKCGSAMVLRTAQKGTNAGKRFWGCATYPTCRAMLPYANETPKSTLAQTRRGA